MPGSNAVCIEQALLKISERYRDKKTFLDLGCGDGMKTVLFAAFDRCVTGVDRMEWLHPATRTGIRFHQEDFLTGRLSLPDKSFDLILSFDVIEHLPDPTPMLKEIARLLRDDGVLILSTPNRLRIGGVVLSLLGRRTFPWYPNPANREIDPYCGHVREYTMRETERTLNREGFSVVRKHRLFYGMGGFGLFALGPMPFYHNIIVECVKSESGYTSQHGAHGGPTVSSAHCP